MKFIVNKINMFFWYGVMQLEKMCGIYIGITGSSHV